MPRESAPGTVVGSFRTAFPTPCQKGPALTRAALLAMHTPACHVTSYLQDGCVLEQNNNSILYFGNIVGQYMWKEALGSRGSRGSEHDLPGTLEQLFVHAPEIFEEVIEVGAGVI
eukprot:1158193-Pelagomonas_calceolata.AAC.5